MKITFPDSGRTVELEGVGMSTLSLLRARYETAYPDKPEFTLVDPLETNKDGDTLSDSFKKEREKYLEAKAEFDKELEAWTRTMRGAQWAAVKLYYAMNVKELSAEQIAAVGEEKLRASIFINLEESIHEGYKELGVLGVDELLQNKEVLDKYIYLWHVCITNAGEQSLFQSMMTTGSVPTQEAVREALFRLRSQV